jgi:starch synthase
VRQNIADFAMAEAAGYAAATDTPQVPERQTSYEHYGMDAERQGNDLSRACSMSLFRDIPLDFLQDAAEKDKPEYIAEDDAPVVIVTSEISPWSKSGGLALVTASLAVEFAERGRRTMAISPMYDNYDGCTLLAEKKIWLMNAEHEIKYFCLRHDLGNDKGVDYIFVDHPCFHRPGGLYYNAQEGVEYSDNLFRFALFSLAAIEAPCSLHLQRTPSDCSPYGDRVLFLSNDWQSALVPVYLTHRMRPQHRYTESRCIFIVHNFGYQGIYPLNKLVPSDRGPIPVIVKNIYIEDLGLENTTAGEHLIYQYPEHERNYHGDDGNVWNLTKGALLTCDRLLTVSPGYADEMKTSEGGFRLDNLVRQREFFFEGHLEWHRCQRVEPTDGPTHRPHVRRGQLG